MLVARSIAPRGAQAPPGGLGATWRTPKAYAAAVAFAADGRCGVELTLKKSRMRLAKGFFIPENWAGQAQNLWLATARFLQVDSGGCVEEAFSASKIKKKF